MMLGRLHSSENGTIWSACKYLELCPVGTIVRNSVDHRAPAGAGTHLRKVRIQGNDGVYRGLDPGSTEWVPCTPAGVWHKPDEPWHPLRSKDLFLPVQVVKQGDDEQ